MFKILKALLLFIAIAIPIFIFALFFYVAISEDNNAPNPNDFYKSVDKTFDVSSEQPSLIISDLTEYVKTYNETSELYNVFISIDANENEYNIDYIYCEYSDANEHLFRKFRASISGKAVHAFPV